MNRRTWILHVVAAWALVAAQPLLDLLGRSPEFFVAHGARTRELVLMLAAVLLPVPVALSLLVALAGRLSSTLQRITLAAIIGVLVGAFVVQLSDRAGATTWSIALPAGGVAAIVVALLYDRLAPLRGFFTLLAMAIVIVPSAFLLKPGIRRLLVQPEPPLASLPPPDPTQFRPAPVVFMLFDELPLVSLLDSHQTIDAELYPNIAALARDGRWFRNATAVSDYTQWALPAMLTGRYPDPKALPTVADHPANLFTLLGRTHRLQVVEAVTALCPEALCSRDRTPLSERLAGMASDIRYVWLHVLLPADLRGGLPPLTNDWANFDRDGWRQERRRRRAARHRERPDKRRIAEAFIDAIDPVGDRPGFYYLHTLLTHFPHEWLPSGRRNATRAAIPGEVGLSWNRDEWAIAQQYQRHLLQVGHADAVVGQLVRRLRASGLYDRALIVLASDHGSAYRPGSPRRPFATEIAPDIMRVPLVIKLPAGTRWADERGLTGDAAHVSDRNVETVDIAPTVVQALGLGSPWPMDGMSLLDPRAPERPQKRILFASGSRRKTYGAEGPDPRESLNRKLNLFGRAGNPYRVPVPARFASLVGRRVSELTVKPGATRIRLDHAEAYRQVDSHAASVPFDVGGAIVTPLPAAHPVFLAASVNGVIGAVTRTWETEPQRFMATPPLTLWRDGPNEVHLFVLEGDDRSPVLRESTKD